MTPEQIDELIKYVLQMGELIASKGYELALRQVYANAISNTVWLLTAITMLLFFVPKTIKKGIAMYHEDSNSIWEFPMLSGGMVGAMSIFYILLNLSGTIKMFVNPNWYAVELLLKTIGLTQ